MTFLLVLLFYILASLEFCLGFRQAIYFYVIRATIYINFYNKAIPRSAINVYPLLYQHLAVVLGYNNVLQNTLYVSVQ